LDVTKAPTKENTDDIVDLNSANLVVLGAARVESAADTVDGYATGLSVTTIAGQR
jgi:hypothetical protein